MVEDEVLRIAFDHKVLRFFSDERDKMPFEGIGNTDFSRWCGGCCCWSFGGCSTQGIKAKEAAGDESKYKGRSFHGGNIGSREKNTNAFTGL